MAAVVTVTRKGHEVLVEIAGTSIEATTEATIELGFLKGRILRQVCVLTGGAGSTVDPIIGTVTDPGAAANAAKVVLENGTAAATVDNAPNPPATFYTPTGILYHRSVPDSGSDNAVTTQYHILVGWG